MDDENKVSENQNNEAVSTEAPVQPEPTKGPEMPAPVKSSPAKKMTKQTWSLIALIGAFIAGAALYYFFLREDADTDVADISSYEECVAAGYPIMESFPEQCAVPGGETFTRILADDEITDATDDEAVVEEEEAVSDCGDDSTYTNEEIGFMFCYPESWGAATFADETESLTSGAGHSITFSDNDKVGATIRTTDWQTEFGRGGGYFDSPLTFSTAFTETSDMGDMVNVNVLLDSSATTLVTAYCSDFIGVIGVDALVKVGAGDYDAMKFYYLLRESTETGIDFSDCADLETFADPVGNLLIDVVESFELI